MSTFSYTNNPVNKPDKTESPNPSFKPKNYPVINIKTKAVPKSDKLILNP